MQIQTTRFGALEIDERAVLTMKRGLLGFEGRDRYVLIQSQADGVFRWMQCVDDPDLAFVVVDPVQWFPDYSVVLSDEDAAALGIGHPDEAAICAIVTLNDRPEEVTANLVGPVVINVHNGRAEQVIIDDSRYHTRHRLMADVAMSRSAA